MDEEKIIGYSDNPDFNEWIDDDIDNNIVSIVGYSFPPSETLYKMNYSQYCEALRDYLLDDDRLLEEVYKDFPTPIAYYLYQAQENYDNPHHRLDLLKSCWESLIFLIYGIVIGEARHKKIHLKEIGVNLKDFYSDRLAQKLLIVENIINLCITKGYVLKSAEIVTLDSISQLRELNKRRNEFEHSFAATPEQQENHYKLLFPELLASLHKVRDIQKINLFRHHSNPSGALNPRCDVFNGHSLDGAKKFLLMKKEDLDIFISYFNSSTIFAHIEEAEMFCVSPFIHFKKDLNDGHPLLMFYKKQVTGGKYLFEIVSKSAQIEIEKANFADRDAELRTLVL